MSLRREEDMLFDDWKAVAPNLVSDGLISEANYKQSRRKVVLLMKDAYDNKGTPPEDLDIRDYVLEEAIGSTWCGAARWMYGLQNLDALPDWDEIQRNAQNLALRKEALLAIGSMNIKKTVSLTATTDVKELVKHGGNNSVRDLIKRQWSLYKPNYTLCAGWYPFTVMCEVFGVAEADIKTTSNGVRYWRKAENQYVLQACHPAKRSDAKAKCYMVLDAVRDIEIAARQSV